MAGMNTQKELLSLIRDVSTEKSQGERRVVNLKRQIQDLQSELDIVNRSLEEAKRVKESAEQDFRGYQLELSINQSSTQTLQGRISSIQDEVTAVSSDLDALKNEEGALRDDFIGKMFGLNAKIRKFQQSVDSASSEAFSSNIVSQDVDMEDANTREVEEAKREVEEAKRDLEDKLAQKISEINKKEHEYESEQNVYVQEQKELDDVNRKVSLMEAVMRASKEFQELGMQTSGLEEECSSLREKLQKKCICPSCQCDNMEMLGGILQKSS